MNPLSPQLFLRSFFLQAGFSDERRQGLGFAWAIDPALRAAYASNPRGLSAARRRHLAAFNVQPHVGGVTLGVAAALERRVARGDQDAVNAAVQLKNTLSTALSAVADAFFWGALRPLACAASFATTAACAYLGFHRPIFIGTAVGVTLFNVPALWVRWKGLQLGLAESELACASIAALPVQTWIRRLRAVAGLIVLAAALAGCFLFSRNWAWPTGAFVAGAALSRRLGGPMPIVAAAGLLGAALSATGRLP